MKKQYVAWASMTETIKYYFEADSKEEAEKMVARVNAGYIDLEDLHKGNFSSKGFEVLSDYPEEA